MGVPRMPVLFDQDCGLCSGIARLLRRLDGRDALELVPFDEAERRGLARDLSPEEFYGSFHVVVADQVVSGPEAIPHVMERLPLGRGPARLLRRSAFLQTVVARGYGWVARRRHLSGCRCHSPIPSKS